MSLIGGVYFFDELLDGGYGTEFIFTPVFDVDGVSNFYVCS